MQREDHADEDVLRAAAEVGKGEGEGDAGSWDIEEAGEGGGELQRVQALLGASAEAVWAGRSASPTSPSLPLFSAGWLQPVTCIANAAAHTSGTLALLSDAIVRQS